LASTIPAIGILGKTKSKWFDGVRKLAEKKSGEFNIAEALADDLTDAARTEK